MVELLILLLIACICGYLGQAFASFTRGGSLMAGALGFMGALLGAWFGRALGLSTIFAVQIGGQAFPVLWSIIGAVLVVLVVGLGTGRRRA